MKHILATLFIFIFSLGWAQVPANETEENQSIENQFDKIYKSSSSYQIYKVIKKAEYNTLKNNVIDSIQGHKDVIQEKNKTIKANNNTNTALKLKLDTIEKELQNAIDFRDSRSVLGIKTSKSVFSILILASYFILIAGLAFFVFKYKQNLSTTKQAIKNLQDLEDEFEAHKKKSLTRFQEVNRKLQDELNKNWKKDK